MKLSFMRQLDEANVYNVNQPLNNVSVQSYLTKLLGRIPDDVKGPLIKKMTKLIINDNTLLQPISQLPPDAPEWAQAAAGVGDLYAFVPNEQVNDRMSHIAHFIQTLVVDAKNTEDKDKAVTATRELSGLPKVENLGILYNKALEYFARGTKKVARVADGMEYLADTKGYTWYKLATAEAFVREGKTLQNCIGRIYTKERCDRDGTTIVIMRDKQGNSVVAMRVQNNKVQEFKGKQNLPPIPKYMPAVIEFIEKNNLTFASTSDLFNAGYVLDDKTKKIRSIDEVLSEQSKRTQVGTTQGGYAVYQMKLGDITDQQLRKMVVSSRVSQSVYSTPQVENTDLLYELATNRGVASAALVRSKVVNQVKDLTDENWKERGFTEPILELINFLGEKGLAESLASSLTANQPMLNTMTFNEKTRKFEPPEAAAEKEVEFNGQRMKVRSYDGVTARALSQNIMSQIKDYSYSSQNMTTEDITAERVLVIPGATEMNALVQTEDGYLIPLSGSAKRVDNVPAARDGSAKDLAMRDLIANYANENDLVIPLSCCSKRGLVKGEEGYKPFNPKPITVTGTISKFDMSSATESEAFMYAQYAASAEHDRTWVYNREPRHYYGKPNTPYAYMLHTSAFSTPDQEHTRHQIAPNVPTDETMIKGWQAVKGARFRNQVPAALYFASSKSLSRFVMAVDDNKNVLSIDTLDNFRGQKGGSARATANKFVNEINEAVKKDGLKLSRASTAGMSLSFSVDRANNKLVTSTQKTATGMDKAAKDEFKMTLNDGVTIRRMSQDEFNEWQETVRSVRNAAHFYLVEKAGVEGADANRIAVIATDKSEKQITRIYSSHQHGDTGVTQEFFNPRIAKYVATFAKEKGISEFPTNASFRDERNSIYRWLKAVKSAQDNTARTASRSLYAISNAAGSYGGARANMTLHEFNNNNYSNWVPRILADNGLVVAEVMPENNRLTLKLTEKGRTALRDIESKTIKSEYQLFNVVAGETTRKEAEPEPAPEPAADGGNAPAAPRERAARAPREAGGETKAGRAMSRFREMAQANGGNIPSRADFIAVLRGEPFNMTPAGASTYYHNIKVKYAQAQGQLGESFTFKEYLDLFAE